MARRKPALGGQGVSRRRRVAAARPRCPTTLRGSVVETAAPGNAPKVVFSGLDSSVAGDIEGHSRRPAISSISNSKNYRMDADVPLMIPEINADHLKLLDRQQAARGWKGRIVTNPNCSDDRRWRWRSRRSASSG